MALWTAKQLSFPPLHEAMSFILFVFSVWLVFVRIVGFWVWMVYPSFPNKYCCAVLCA
jgi:hypothetical protein